jgi:hypothetical protein
VIWCPFTMSPLRGLERVFCDPFYEYFTATPFFI